MGGVRASRRRGGWGDRAALGGGGGRQGRFKSGCTSGWWRLESAKRLEGDGGLDPPGGLSGEGGYNTPFTSGDRTGGSVTEPLQKGSLRTPPELPPPPPSPDLVPGHCLVASRCPTAGGEGGVCATKAGAHQGQTSREGEKDIWWTARTARGGTGHLGLTHTETQRSGLWTACGQRRMDSKHSQTTPATTSTSSIRQLLGAADAQTAHHATSSTAPARQPLGSANAETTPARAPAAVADRTQRPDATCEGKNG